MVSDLTSLGIERVWQIKLYGLSFLPSVWDNTLMTFSQALVSKAQSVQEGKLL